MLCVEKLLEDSCAVTTPEVNIPTSRNKTREAGFKLLTLFFIDFGQLLFRWIESLNF